MHKCACVPVCVTECMNHLLVISHKKHIISTAQDKALRNPITGYNHSPQPHRGREREAGEGNKSVKRVKGRKDIICSHWVSFCLSIFCLPTFTPFCLSVSHWTYFFSLPAVYVISYDKYLIKSFCPLVSNRDWIGQTPDENYCIEQRGSQKAKAITRKVMEFIGLVDQPFIVVEDTWFRWLFSQIERT